MRDMASRIYEALDNNLLPEYVNINEPNNERKGLVRPLAIHPDAREYLCILNAGFVTILMPGEDTLIEKGFSIEEAHDTTQAFEQYVNEHRDEIEALRIIYNNNGEPITYAILKDLENRMKMENYKFTPSQLWNTYSIVNPSNVVHFGTKEEKEALTNIIQLVRYAYHQVTELRSLSSMAAQRFELWCGQIQRTMTDAQKNTIRQIVNYIVANGSCTIKEIKEDDKTIALQMIRKFGTIAAVNEAIVSLSQFLIYNRKVA